MVFAHANDLALDEGATHGESIKQRRVHGHRLGKSVLATIGVFEGFKGMMACLSLNYNHFKTCFFLKLDLSLNVKLKVKHKIKL